MSRRTNNWNAFETSTTGPLGIGATSVAVDSAAGLVAPLYLVIDPDDPAKREWIRVNTINANTLENLVRNLPGSVGDVAHLAGAKIRSIPTKQIFDDLFQDIEDDVLSLSQHETDGGDPHAAAGYIKVPIGDARYLQLDGGSMSGFLTLFADPTSPLHAATKQYADARETAAIAYSDSLDHDHAAPIATHAAIASAHHGKYDDIDLAASAIIVDFENRISAIESGGAPPTAHTHTAAETTTGTFVDARIPNLAASKVTSGAFADARIPSLNASKVNAGTFAVARIPDLSASKITPGSFQVGGYTFPGSSDVGIGGDFNVNGNVNLTGLPAGAGTGDVRITLTNGLLSTN